METILSRGASGSPAVCGREKSCCWAGCVHAQAFTLVLNAILSGAPLFPPLLAKSCFFFFFHVFLMDSSRIGRVPGLKGTKRKEKWGFKFCLFHSNQGPQVSTHPCNSYLRNESKETECEAGTLWGQHPDRWGGGGVWESTNSPRKERQHP